MKCPKCSYLGFDTGDRCKNCGYDFSLSQHSGFVVADTDVTIRRSEEGPPFDVPLDSARFTPPAMEESARMRPAEADARTAAPITGPRTTPGVADLPPLPLFFPASGDDTPLITVPAKPRAPLAVRRAPDTTRLRVTPQARVPEPSLDFREEHAGEQAVPTPPAARAPIALGGTDRIAGRRSAAAAIDHALLLGIDAVVLYFTLRIAGLSSSEIGLIPPVPFVVFLVLVKLAYFTAFTAVGGQTIGKMAVGVRVVADDLGALDPRGAVRRTMAATLAHLTFGLGYLPALIGPDRRALHDRLAHTRVVAPPPA